MFGFDLEHVKVNIRWEGEALVSLTSIDDTACFAAHALTRLPREGLKNSNFFIEGDRIVSDSTLLTLERALMHEQSFHDLTQQLEKLSSKPPKIKRTGRKEIEEPITASPCDMFAHFFSFEDGKGTHAHGVANGHWPGFKPYSGAERTLVLQHFFMTILHGDYMWCPSFN
jgi:hypothetical protein